MHEKTTAHLPIGGAHVMGVYLHFPVHGSQAIQTEREYHLQVSLE